MSPIQLTPRSKVRAMLAAFSDDSENDSELGLRKAAEIAGTVSEAQYSIACKATAKPSVSESSDSEDVSVSMKPRGRLVSRMFAGLLDDNEERDTLPASEQARREGPKESVNISKKPSSGSPAGNHYHSDDATRPLRRKLTKSYGSYETQTSTPPNVRKSSPGLFVSPGPASNDLSPTRATNTGESNHVGCDSDSDLPENLAANARFMALVERKRQERLAKEAEAARKEKLAQSRRIDSYGRDDDEESGNSATEERLTQQARPTRKASKKALEEMRRETQRIARNMQLAHEARTRKKITKQSLFEKFNFKPEPQNTGNSEVGGGHSPAAAPCSSSAAGSDAERVHSTPPTSPASHDGPSPKSDRTSVGTRADPPKGKLLATTQAKDSLTAENHIRRSPTSPMLQSECPQLALITNDVEGSDGEYKDAPKLDKGKGRAVGPPGGSFAVPGTSKKAVFTQPPIRVRPPKRIETNGFDSESDLEIVRETKPRKYTIFDKYPRQEERQSNSLHALRLLARLASPGRKNPKAQSITPVELQHDLRRRARQQAAQDREERLQQLRDRGVILPTAEERAEDAEEVDNLIAKAREEADVIMKREKAAARKERKEKGEVDPLGESSASEDDDWADDEEHSESELSGSDDEDEYEEDDAEDDEQLSGRDGEEEKEDENPSVAALLDDEASQDYGSDDEMEDIPTLKRRKGMRTRIVSDDEEDNSGSAAVSFARIKPNKQIIPGLPVSSAAPLGLTQMFAATMADSQVEGAESNQQEQDSLTYPRDLPAPSLPDFGLTRLEDNSQEAIKDSQADRDETHSQDQHSLGPRIDLHYSQSQVQYESVPLSATQISEFPDPSQDSGFQKSSPIKRRFATTQPSSPDVPQGPVTTETMESPTIRKRGRLRRRMEVQVFSDEENTGEENEHDNFEIETNAFDVMRKASKKILAVPDSFDKAKSEAKAMVDEQAQESEDEYAGLGGASGDDESEGGEDAAQMMDMIDDDGKTIVNEREIAAFYADKERASDEKQVEKLFKDITNGTLRRKRGADYGLSDSDDDLETRRRRKQREFMKMRKALLEDENISKIATNPKKLAFLRAIEDHDQEEQFDFLDKAVDPSQDLADSQDLTHGRQANAPTSVAGGTKRKSNLDSTSKVNDENCPPAHLRKSKRPSTLVEIRESLTSLITEPHAVFDVTNTEDLSDNDENSYHSPPTKRRRTANPVIDRIAVKRADSSPSLNETRLFFQDPTTTAPSGLRVPALLRRAAASHLSLSSTTAVETERMAGTTEKDGDGVVKRGGKASSSINYGQRERERVKSTFEGKRERKKLLREQVEGRRVGIARLVGGWRFD